MLTEVGTKVYDSEWYGDGLIDWLIDGSVRSFVRLFRKQGQELSRRSEAC